MLSEEEKKAIEYWQYIRDTQIYDGYIGQVYSVVLLNLIEKQSKEIVELKNGLIDFWKRDKEIEERIRNKFVSNDKIKAKIEEYKEKCKNCNFKGKICDDFTKNYDCIIGVCLNELQSLLEEDK